jgi:hypothetical protein
MTTTPDDDARNGITVPEDKPIKDMTMLELLANQVDQDPIEQAQRTDQAERED